MKLNQVIFVGPGRKPVDRSCPVLNFYRDRVQIDMVETNSGETYLTEERKDFDRAELAQ